MWYYSHRPHFIQNTKQPVIYQAILLQKSSLNKSPWSRGDCEVHSGPKIGFVFCFFNSVIDVARPADFFFFVGSTASWGLTHKRFSFCGKNKTNFHQHLSKAGHGPPLKKSPPTPQHQSTSANFAECFLFNSSTLYWVQRMIFRRSLNMQPATKRSNEYSKAPSSDWRISPCEIHVIN